MKNTFFVFCVANVICFSCWMDPERHVLGAENIAPSLEVIRRKHDLPAVGAAVIQGGRLVAVAATGTRKYGTGIKVTAQDKFHIGSCTKTMTATLIGVLVERRKLDAKIPLEKALPGLAETMHPDLLPVTLAHLLSHHSGLTSDSWPTGMSFADVHDLRGPPRQQRLQYARLILKQPPVAKPGNQYLYSNVNYAVAGVIAEEATETAWEALMRELIFKPLAMKSAGFGAMGSGTRVDQPWQHIVRNGRVVPILPGPRADNPPAIGPAGTVHCSLADWAKFVQSHLDGAAGRKSILSPAMFAALHTPRFGGDYAFGWVVTERPWGGGTVLTHGGSNNQNYAVVWMAPKKNFGVLAVTNQGGDAAANACDEIAAAMINRFLAN